MSVTTPILRFARNTPVARKISAAVAVAVVSGGVVGLVGLASLQSARDAADASYQQNAQGLGVVGDLRYQLGQVQLNTAYGLLSISASDTAKYSAAETAAQEALSADLTEYQEETAPTSEELALAQSVSTSYAEWLDLSNQAVTAYAAGDMATVTTLSPQADTALAATKSGIDDLVQSELDAARASVAEVENMLSEATLLLVSVLVGGSVLALLGGFFVAGSIKKGLLKVTQASQRLAAGDLTTSTGVAQQDEIGRLAAALDEAQASLRSVMSSVVASADAVASSAEELSASSARISVSAEETSAQSGVVAAAADEVSRNVATVAAGAEEMGASIREISQNANEAARVAAQAVTEAQTTTATITKLGTSSQEIGEVIKVITSIAEQTNLLALNATIEAARAGEAGKGFAVVATEVKELAQETARATEDIARRVEAIQGDTTKAIQAIGGISEVIGSINDFQLTIASAVEEQTATTNEMSRSVQEAAGGSTEIATNITGVSAAASSTTQSLGQTRLAVDELSRMAGDLRSTVGRFTY